MRERVQNLLHHKLDRLAVEIDVLKYEIQKAEELYKEIMNANWSIKHMHRLADLIQMEGESAKDAIELAEERCPGIFDRMAAICDKLEKAHEKLTQE